MKNAFKTTKRSCIILALITFLVLMICGFGMSYKNDMKSVSAETQTGTVVYDYYDLTGDYFRSNTVHVMFNASISNEDINDFSIKTHVRIINDNHAHIAFGILLPSTATDSHAYGYWLGIHNTNGFAVAYTHLGQKGDNIFNVSESERIGTHAKMDEMYAPEGFVLEYGAKAVEEGRYVYVKVNGETVLESTDTATRDTSVIGNKIVADYAARCDLSTTKDVSEELNEVLVEKVDYYDLTGNVHRANNFEAEDGMLFGAIEAKNFEFISRVALAKDHPLLPLGIAATDSHISENKDTIMNAYWLDIHNGVLSLYPYGIYGSGDLLKATACVALPESAQAADGFILAYGIKEIYMGGETLVGRYLYATVNGEEVASWIDYSVPTIGTEIIADTTARATLTSSYLTWDKATVYDWYDITGEISTEYSVPRASINTELNAGQFPTFDTVNVAMKAKLTVDGAPWSGDGGISFSILKYTDLENDQFGTGYNFRWTGMLELYAGNMWGVGVGGRTFSYIKFGVNSGDTFDFEFGSVKCYFKGEYYGEKAYVNIDGKEMISLINTEPSKFNGSYIMAPVINAEDETVTVSTGYPTRTFSCVETVGVDLDATVTTILDESMTVFVPMQIGYVMTSAKLGTESLTIEELNGGYKVTIPKNVESDTLTFTTEEKNLTVALPQTENAMFSASETVPYGGTFTLSVVPKQGKNLVSLSVNGKDVTTHLTIENGAYIYTAYTVRENITVDAAFEDKTYSATKQASSGGKIEAADTVVAGSAFTFTVIADEGYYISSVKVNGQSVSFDSEGSHTVEAVYANLTIEAEFAVKPAEVGGDNAENEEKGCSGSMNGGSGILTILFASAMALGVMKKKGKNDE